MKAMDILATTLRRGYVHPTTVLNTLIDLENWGGAPALLEFEQRLAHSTQALAARRHPHAPLAQAWLEAVRCYMQTYTEQVA